MKKILVTGAGGVIGMAVINTLSLKKEYDIHVIISGTKKHSFPDGVTEHVSNITEIGKIEEIIFDLKPEYMVHLAWAFDDLGYRNKDTNILWVERTLSIVRKFYSCNGKRFVFAGSMMEYGQPGGRMVENCIGSQRTVYGESKLAIESLCLNFCRNNGLEFISDRIFSNYGERDIRVGAGIPAALLSFMGGQEFVCKSPNNVWDFVYVKDVSEAIVHTIESRYVGSVNIGTGRPTIVGEAYKRIAEILGCRELLKFSSSNEKPTVLIADTSTLSEKIGYSCDTLFEDGIVRVVNWWKRNYRNIVG